MTTWRVVAHGAAAVAVVVVVTVEARVGEVMGLLLGCGDCGGKFPTCRSSAGGWLDRLEIGRHDKRADWKSAPTKRSCRPLRRRRRRGIVARERLADRAEREVAQ